MFKQILKLFNSANIIFAKLTFLTLTKIFDIAKIQNIY